MYSTDTKAQHGQEFEYHNKNKYSEKYDPADFKDMKDNAIERYKQDQLESEKNNKDLTEIIEFSLATEQDSKDSPTQTQKPPSPDKYATRQKKM